MGTLWLVLLIVVIFFAVFYILQNIPIAQNAKNIVLIIVGAICVLALVARLINFI